MSSHATYCSTAIAKASLPQGYCRHYYAATKAMSILQDSCRLDALLFIIRHILRHIRYDSHWPLTIRYYSQIANRPATHCLVHIGGHRLRVAAILLIRYRQAIAVIIYIHSRLRLGIVYIHIVFIAPAIIDGISHLLLHYTYYACHYHYLLPLLLITPHTYIMLRSLLYTLRHNGSSSSYT